MDAKDLRTETALIEHSNHVNTNNYGQSSLSFQSEDKNKSYHDSASNSLSKVDIQTTRPCAVIGPDRILPQPVAVNNPYIKQPHAEPWQFPQPPEYPQKFTEFQNLSRNISPRQTFQENMQRIMVPSRSMKTLEDTNFANEKSDPIPKNFTKINMPTEGKYCDVPYTVNPLTNDQKSVRSSVSNVNHTLLRSAWPPSGVAVRPTRPFGAPELYQYPPDFTNCTGPHALPINRPFQAGHDDSAHMYSDPYRGGNIRYEPYPTVRDRNVRYEYINYSNPFPTSHFPPHKYDPQKLGGTPGLSPQGYPAYPQIPLKYLREPRGYQRSPNPQPNYNVPYHSQGIHPNYGSIPGNCLPNKLYAYSPDGNYNVPLITKPSYDNNKPYLKYDSVQTRHYPPENMYLNDLSRTHQMKPPLAMPSSMNMPLMPSYPCYRKDNLPVRHYDLSVQFKNMDPSYNTQISRIPSQFSPVDSHISNENTMFAISPEDCGYASQSSTTSVRSTDSGINMFHRYSHMNRASPIISRNETDSNNLSNKNKKGIDVRQFLQMWNEGDDENSDNNPNKDIIIQSNASDAKLNSELYVLGLVNVPSEELGKYEHIQKVSKLPDNIKGYTSIDLLNQFEEAIESSNMNDYTKRTPNLCENQIPFNSNMNIKGTNLPNRPLSPLDVESRITQSVIHKEVGCNFEIKPCSPKMLNVEVAAPVKTLLEERAIEKVTNQLLVKSPNALKDMEENVNDCQQNRRRSLSRDDNTNISSCKMSKTQYSIDRENDKSNYSIQDLESNSGVCLASLPRLDNDIELSFPEVNQQFINANRVDSDGMHSTDSNSKFAKQNEIKNINFSIHDVEQPKLSKYRKNKGNKESSETSYSILQATRTDSVIIKNPESSENIADENSTSTSFTDVTDSNIKFKSTTSPINLAVNNICTKMVSKDVSDFINNENLSNSTLNLSLNSDTQIVSGGFNKEISASSPSPLEAAKNVYDIPDLIVSNHENDFSKSCLHNVECLKEKDEKIFLIKSNDSIPIVESQSENELEILSNLLPKDSNDSSDFVTGKASSNNSTVSIFNKDSSLERLSLPSKNDKEIDYEASDTEKSDADQRARHEKLYRLLEERVNDLPENLLTPLSESTINDVSQDGFMSENEIDHITEFNENRVNDSEDRYNRPKDENNVELTNTDNLLDQLDSKQNSNYYDFTEINFRSKQVVFNNETNVDYQQTRNSAFSKIHVQNKQSDPPQTDNKIYDKSKKSPDRPGSFVSLDEYGEETKDSNHEKRKGASCHKDHLKEELIRRIPEEDQNSQNDKENLKHEKREDISYHNEISKEFNLKINCDNQNDEVYSNQETREGASYYTMLKKEELNQKINNEDKNSQMHNVDLKQAQTKGVFDNQDILKKKELNMNINYELKNIQNCKEYSNNDTIVGASYHNSILEEDEEELIRRIHYEDKNNQNHKEELIHEKREDYSDGNKTLREELNQKRHDEHQNSQNYKEHPNQQRREIISYHSDIAKEQLNRKFNDEDRNSIHKEDDKHKEVFYNEDVLEEKELNLKIDNEYKNSQNDEYRNSQIHKEDEKHKEVFYDKDILKEKELNLKIDYEYKNSQNDNENSIQEKCESVFFHNDILEDEKLNRNIHTKDQDRQGGRVFIDKDILEEDELNQNIYEDKKKIIIKHKKIENALHINTILEKEKSNRKMNDGAVHSQNQNEETSKLKKCEGAFYNDEDEGKKITHEIHDGEQNHNESLSYEKCDSCFYNNDILEKQTLISKINDNDLNSSNRIQQCYDKEINISNIADKLIQIETCNALQLENDKNMKTVKKSNASEKHADCLKICQVVKHVSDTESENYSNENGTPIPVEEKIIENTVKRLEIHISDHHSDVDVNDTIQFDPALNKIHNTEAIFDHEIKQVRNEEIVSEIEGIDDFQSNDKHDGRLKTCNKKNNLNDENFDCGHFSMENTDDTNQDVKDQNNTNVKKKSKQVSSYFNNKIHNTEAISDHEIKQVKNEDIFSEIEGINDFQSNDKQDGRLNTCNKENNLNDEKFDCGHFSIENTDDTNQDLKDKNNTNVTKKSKQLWSNFNNKIHNAEAISDHEIKQVKNEDIVSEIEGFYDFQSNDKHYGRLETCNKENNLNDENFDCEHYSMENTDDTNQDVKDKNNTNLPKKTKQVANNFSENNIRYDSIEDVTNIDTPSENYLEVAIAKKELMAPIKDAQNTTYCSKNIMDDTESDHKICKHLKDCNKKSVFTFHKELYSVQIQKLSFYQEGCIHECKHKLLENDSNLLKHTDANDLKTTEAFIHPKSDHIELFNETNTPKVTFEELNPDMPSNFEETRVTDSDIFVKDKNLEPDCNDTYLKKCVVTEKSNVGLNSDQNNIFDNIFISKLNMKSSTSKHCSSEYSNEHNTVETNHTSINNNTNIVENKLLLNIINKNEVEAENSETKLIDDASVLPSDSITICSECPLNPRKEDKTKCFNSNLPFFTRRPTLKRALSESALYTRYDESISNKSSSWPNKRKRIDPNVNDDSNSNESTVCTQNRRNSISSVYHEENISFCILIDNNCLITQDAEGTVCFADIQEERVDSVVNNEFESHGIDFETVNSSLDYGNSQLSETYPVECVTFKDDDNWVEDVACVETVVSDDVVEDDDEVFVEQYSSLPQSSDRFDHTKKLKNIYGDEMCSGDINLIKTLYATPQMDMNKTLQEKESLILESTKQYETDCLESILSDAYIDETTSNDIKCIETDVCSMDYRNDTKERLKLSGNFKTNVFFDDEKLHNRDKCLQENLDGLERELSMNFQDSFTAAEDDIAHSCESTVSEECCLDQSIKRLKHKRSSSSPEVSSTTEEKKTGILLKITNYNGSRISQIDNVDLDDNKRIRCKLTERNGYSHCKNDFNSHRPLLTKAAQKYIPPIKETISDLKVKLFLPPHSLMKLKKMKICQEPKLTLQKHLINGKPNFNKKKIDTVKKPKPKFEDVLKSLDEVQSQMQKRKTKKVKSSIPKVIIKKSENGSHYARTSNNETFNPDLTGRKWQPWVFLEKNLFIDKMAVKGETRAVYCHRKKCYILAEQFQKYKSMESTKFVISQPKLEPCSPGPLKYTIKLKQNY